MWIRGRMINKPAKSSATVTFKGVQWKNQLISIMNAPISFHHYRILHKELKTRTKHCEYKGNSFPLCDQKVWAVTYSKAIQIYGFFLSACAQKSIYFISVFHPCVYRAGGKSSPLATVLHCIYAMYRKKTAALKILCMYE